ncbi:helix-turn-helix domain-containing protein [Anaerospora hongkongensis]|uniref:helix-turn-helix domain-containing protein n=1 Tax=Anaerospora hongkongensis TaxID=244830 RepID=UPI00289E6F62|nr:helix-turn-helix transcriptional regulator [Anaerospora hongkongensis]
MLNITRNVYINEGSLPGNTIVDRFHWARLRAGMDIVDLARAAGLNSATVSKVENGRQIPIVVTFRALAETLKQPVWFLGGYDVLPEDTLGSALEKHGCITGSLRRILQTGLGLMRRRCGCGKRICARWRTIRR